MSGVASTARNVVATVRAERITFLAGSIAHSSFVSLVPLTVLGLVLLTSVGDDALARRVIAVVDATLAPGSAALLARAREGSVTTTSASIAGIVVLLWGATRLFRGLDVAFSTLYRSSASNTFANRLRDGLAVLVALGASIAVLFVVESALSAIAGDAADALAPVGLVAGLVVALFPVYYVFPDVEVTPREVLPGVVVAAVGWAVLAELFRWYLGIAGRFETYGVFGSVLVLATWLYLASLVLLVGASVNVVRRRMGREDGGGQGASS